MTHPDPDEREHLSFLRKEPKQQDIQPSAADRFNAFLATLSAPPDLLGHGIDVTGHLRKWSLDPGVLRKINIILVIVFHIKPLA